MIMVSWQCARAMPWAGNNCTQHVLVLHLTDSLAGAQLYVFITVDHLTPLVAKLKCPILLQLPQPMSLPSRVCKCVMVVLCAHISVHFKRTHFAMQLVWCFTSTICPAPMPPAPTPGLPARGFSFLLTSIQVNLPVHFSSLCIPCIKLPSNLQRRPSSPSARIPSFLNPPPAMLSN